MLRCPRRNRYAPILPAVLSLVVFFDCTPDLTLCISFRSRLPLVVQLFTLAKSDFHFHTGILEIQRKRYQRQTVLLDLAKHPVDLLMVHQKLSDTHRICPEQAVLFIRGNVHSFHELQPAKHVPLVQRIIVMHSE